MSAFAHRHLDALASAASALTLLGSPVAAQLNDLLELLERTTECTECGLVGWSSTAASLCQHCFEAARRTEAAEDRAGVR